MWRGNYERWYPIPALSGVRVGLEGLQNTERRLTLGLRGEEFVQAPRELVFFSPLAHFSASAGIVRESSYSHAFWEVAHSELVTTYRQQTEVTLPDNRDPALRGTYFPGPGRYPRFARAHGHATGTGSSAGARSNVGNDCCGSP